MRFEAGPAEGKVGPGDYVYVQAAVIDNFIENLLFEDTCHECSKMSAIPQGAFAALQVHKNFDRYYDSRRREEEEFTGNKDTSFDAKNLEEGREPTPLKYNSKLMNSIWGLYNRYSVHNFKKIDANDVAGVLAEGPAASCIIGTNTNGAGH